MVKLGAALAGLVLTTACAIAATPVPSEIALVRESDGRMLAPVRIDGAGPYLFVLDTGASVTAFDTMLVEELGLARESFEVTVFGVSGASIAPAHQAVTLGLGDDHIALPWVVALDLPDIAGARGVLGMDVLAQRVIEIDGDRSVLRLWRAPFAPPSNLAWSRAELVLGPYDLPHVVVRINGEEGLALVDTGLAGMIVDPAFAERAGVPEDNRPIELVDVLHAPTLAPRSGRARLRIGEARWTIERVALIRPRVLDELEFGERIEAILGVGVFGSSSLVIDIGERALYVIARRA
jgi:predicted aspartyl protease